MTRQQFVTGLILTCLLSISASWGLTKALSLEEHTGLFYATIVLLLPMTIIVYWLAKRMSVSTDKYAIVRLVMGNMMLKLLLAVIVVVVYTRVVEIETTLFILPFFVTYISFTVFETILLHNISKVSH